MASGPRCLSWRMLMSSGPVELLFLESFIARAVCWLVTTISSVCSFWVLQSIVLLFGLVLCLTVLVNCLLNRVVFCLSLVAVLLSNLMEVLVELFVFLLLRARIVFQSLWVLWRWSQSYSRCSRQSCVLLSWICLSIRWLSSGNCGSLGLVDLI